MTWPGSDSRVLDVRTYKLVPGGGAEFDRLFREHSLPMLERLGIDVVCYGSSVDDDDSYYLIRAFASADRRDEQLDSFYGSDEWRQIHREAVLSLIESHNVVLIELTTTTRQAFSAAMSPEAA